VIERRFVLLVVFFEYCFNLACITSVDFVAEILMMHAQMLVSRIAMRIWRMELMESGLTGERGAVCQAA
jgi:hypothetical protein